MLSPFSNQTRSSRQAAQRQTAATGYPARCPEYQWLDTPLPTNTPSLDRAPANH
jgi:hypothetical protein